MTSLLGFKHYLRVWTLNKTCIDIGKNKIIFHIVYFYFFQEGVIGKEEQDFRKE